MLKSKIYNHCISYMHCHILSCKSKIYNHCIKYMHYHTYCLVRVRYTIIVSSTCMHCHTYCLVRVRYTIIIVSSTCTVTYCLVRVRYTIIVSSTCTITHTVSCKSKIYNHCIKYMHCHTYCLVLLVFQH